MILSLFTNIKMVIAAAIAGLIGFLGLVAWYFKFQAERAESKLKATEQKLKTEVTKSKLANERVKRHESRQKIEDDVYSADESRVDERLHDDYRY